MALGKFESAWYCAKCVVSTNASFFEVMSRGRGNMGLRERKTYPIQMVRTGAQAV
jgi:hypothetical protein